MYAQLQVYGQLTYKTLYVDYDSAWQYKDLKVIPIRFKGPGGLAAAIPGETITLNQAL